MHITFIVDNFRLSSIIRSPFSKVNKFRSDEFVYPIGPIGIYIS